LRVPNIDGVEVLDELPEDLLDPAWEFYEATFSPLRTRSATRHLMTRSEFEPMMADRRAPKYLTRDAAGVTGLSVMTDDLDAVPLISPPFFAAHWPELYRQRRLIYCVFIGAVPGERGDGVFVALQREIYDRMVAPVDASVLLDICLWNEDQLRLPWAVEGILTQIGGAARATRVDSQSYWLYEFSAAS
jgi:hypothetical protein